MGATPSLSVPYWQKDLFDRNRPLTDEELDAVLPSQGYEVSKMPFPQFSVTLYFHFHHTEQILH